MARDNGGSDTVKSLSLRRKKLEKYFGILSKEEAEELEREIKEMRKRSDESINRHSSHLLLPQKRELSYTLWLIENFYLSDLSFRT
jgi:hypothetical protein